MPHLFNGPWSTGGCTIRFGLTKAVFFVAFLAVSPAVIVESFFAPEVDEDATVSAVALEALKAAP